MQTVDTDALAAKIAAQIQAGETGEARNALYQLRLLAPEHPRLAELESSLESWYGSGSPARQREAWREWVPTTATMAIATGVLFLVSVGAFAMRHLGDLPPQAAWTPWGFAVLGVLSLIATFLVASSSER